MATLVISCDGVVSQEVELIDSPLRIGRDALNDVVLDGERGVSRFHAEVGVEDGECRIVDLGSLNGLWSNGRKVSAAILRPGAIVTLGEYSLEVIGELASAPKDTDEHPIYDDGEQTLYAPPQVASPPIDVVDASRPPAPRALSQPNRAKQAVFFAITVLVAGALIAFALLRETPSAEPDRRVAGTSSVVPDPGSPPVNERQPNGSSRTPVIPPTNETERLPQRSTPDAAAGSVRRESGRNPAPANVPAPLVPRLPGESQTDWESRSSRLEFAYQEASQRVKDNPREAIARLEAIEREHPGFRDVPALLAQARTRVRALAQSVISDGFRAEQAGDFRGALSAYTRARQIDPSVKIDDRVASVRGKLDEQGLTAFNHARVLDSFGKSAEAITEYQRVLDLLPPEQSQYAYAAKRLQELKPR
ncbi:MAG: FHA domain-containing protein [Vicinamibacterales bacterium]